MPEAAELSLPRPDFTTRHPEVSEIDVANAPKTLGIALGTVGLKDYPAMLQSAISIAHEYSDSPLESVAIFADALIDPEANNIIAAFFPNFLEGSIDHRLASFKRDRIRVNWIGGESLFVGNAKRSIQSIHERTDTNPQLDLNIVLDPSRMEDKPDILLVSKKTSQETQEALMDAGTMAVSVGDSLTDVNGKLVDRALLSYARRSTSQSSISE